MIITKIIPLKLITCIFMCVLLSRDALSQESDIGDEDLGTDISLDGSSTAKPSDNELPNGRKRTNFSEDRFVHLFGRRTLRPRTGLVPRFVERPKATLPPFIKQTPGILRVSPSTAPPSRNSVTQRSTVAPQVRGSTTRPTPTPRGGINNIRGVNNINQRSRSNVPTVAIPISTTTEVPRRRFGSNSAGVKRNVTSLQSLRNRQNF